MSDQHAPLLSYDRIDANRRTTRVLLAVFAVVILPVISGAAVYVMPWITMIGLSVAYQLFGAASIQARLESLAAEAIAKRSADGTIDLADLPSSVLWLEGGALALAAAVVVLAFVGATVLLISRFGSRAILRVARARPVDPDRESYLVRLVENLCIGAGLPLPNIFLVESAAPNAFAIGRDPHHASLVVTRGLLTLLDQRELEGVIAHELSHIGNHDIRLSTTLAALVGTINLPFRMVTAPLRFVFGLPWGVRIVAMILGFRFISLVVAGFWFGISDFSDEKAWEGFPPFLWWWALHATLTPPYVVVVAPMLALLIRQAVSRQREFLADADAVLLTRDPEGLALALVKVAAARGDQLRVGEGSLHLYFMDPWSNRSSLLHRVFPSHPPVAKRIELLARMGSGITSADLQRAREAGMKAEAKAEKVEIDTTLNRLDSDSETDDAKACPVSRSDASVDNRSSVEPDADDENPTTGYTPLYEQPDGWSRVLRRLPPDAVIRATGKQGQFVQVVTHDDVTGYVSSGAGLLQAGELEETVKELGERGIA